MWVLRVQHAACACAWRVDAVHRGSSCAYRSWRGHRAAMLSPGPCHHGPRVSSPCPRCPVPAELLTWGWRWWGSVWVTPAPCPPWVGGGRPAAHFKGSGQIPPWGQPKLTRALLCHGDGGRLLWQRGEVRGPLSCPTLALSSSIAGSPAWTHPALDPSCPQRDPPPAGLARTRHPSLGMAVSSAEHCWGPTHCRSGLGISLGQVCFWWLRIPGIRVRAPSLQSWLCSFRLVPGSPHGSGQDPRKRGSCRGAGCLPAWKIAP